MTESEIRPYPEYIHLGDNEIVTEKSRALDGKATPDIIAKVKQAFRDHGDIMAYHLGNLTIDEMDTYQDMRIVQEYAEKVNDLVELGKTLGIAPKAVVDSTELQAKLAHLAANDPTSPLNDSLIDEIISLEQKWQDENTKGK